MNRMFSKPKRKKKIQRKSELPNTEEPYKTIERNTIPDDDLYGFSPFQRMNKFDGYNYDKAKPIQLERGRTSITRSRSFIVPTTPRHHIQHNPRLSSLNRAGLRSRFPSPLQNLENINEFRHIQDNFYNSGFYHR